MNHVYYLSGPVTGHPDYMEEFAAAEAALKENGLRVINPTAVNALLPKDTDYEAFMHLCFAMLDLCDTIVLLNGWEESSGAKRELEYAQKHGLRVLLGTEIL